MLNPFSAVIDDRDPVVIMRSESGVEVLGEDHVYLLSHASLRDLLFLGNSVRLTENGQETERAVARPGQDRQWIGFLIDGVLYHLQRVRLVWVARGDVPVDRLLRAGVR